MIARQQIIAYLSPTITTSCLSILVGSFVELLFDLVFFFLSLSCKFRKISMTIQQSLSPFPQLVFNIILLFLLPTLVYHFCQVNMFHFYRIFLFLPAFYNNFFLRLELFYLLRLESVFNIRFMYKLFFYKSLIFNIPFYLLRSWLYIIFKYFRLKLYWLVIIKEYRFFLSRLIHWLRQTIQKAFSDILLYNCFSWQFIIVFLYLNWLPILQSILVIYFFSLFKRKLFYYFLFWFIDHWLLFLFLIFLLFLLLLLLILLLYTFPHLLLQLKFKKFHTNH